MIKIIDLNFFSEQTIASFLIETSDGPFLIETGPDSTFSNLEKGIKESGYDPEEIKHVLLTHIHLDHAGAAWHFAENGATIHVHSKGAPHMAHPSKLLQSAERIYGDKMDFLWGTMKPISSDQIHIVEDSDEIRLGNTKIKALYTPGHAQHHLAYVIDDVVFTGDVGGVRIDGKAVEPPCPPPDINLELWQKSIDRLRELRPEALYLTHFGKYEDVGNHLDELEERLYRYADWMKQQMIDGKEKEQITKDFERYLQSDLKESGLDKKGLEKYEIADPSWMSVSGLMRYWKKYHPEELEKKV